MLARRSAPIFCFLLASATLLGAVPFTLAQSTPARVVQPVDMQNLVTLHGNVHPLARPEFDEGVAPDDLPMQRMLLVLKRSADQETSLRQFLDDQQTKPSPRFHQWLSPTEFGQQFGPADADVQAVTDWLTSQGFTVAKVAAGRTVIEFSGSAGLVRQVLGTEIHRYRVNGEDHWANVSDPQIPAALAPVVAGFASLNNFRRTPLFTSMGTFTRSRLTGQVQPLFTYPVNCGNGETGCYYFALGPTDFATIYNVAPLWNAGTDGTGVTIAVVGETNINPQDVVNFRSMFGLPANTTKIILAGPDPGITAFDEPEADLDVEWSGAVARGAAIDFVVSESTESTAGIDLSALYIVDNNLAPVMSESYGGCEADLGTAGNLFHGALWEQAAAEGITALIAAGDSGPAGCDSNYEDEVAAQYGLAVSGMASSPFDVAVGGTDFSVDSSNVLNYWSLTNNASEASAFSYIPEITWNNSCADSTSLTGCTPPPDTSELNDGIYLEAGSGGPSSCTTSTGTFPNETCGGHYAKPAWQTGNGVPNDGARDLPDVSLFAGNGLHGSFYITCQTDANSSDGGNPGYCNLSAPYTNFQGGAGTSAAAQAFAGIMAMVVQRHGRQGDANYVLYPLAAQSGASCNTVTSGGSGTCIFNDVTTGNNSVICQGGTPDCSNTASGQYGSVVSGGAPAYPTTTGYDLATGLGSVNAANLVNNWKSNFTPSSVTLSLSTNPATNPVTLTHGQPLGFNVQISSAGGTATGDVSLIANTSSSANVSPITAVGPFTLSGGIASGSTIMLPGGSYTVTAHYPGNGTLAASDSSPGIPVSVAKESSETQLHLITPGANQTSVYTLNTVTYGSPYMLRMDVTNGSGQLCAPIGSFGEQFSPTYACPTGKVTVSPTPTEQNPPTGTTPGTYTLNPQGYAEDIPIQQSPGKYNFVGSYQGDGSYQLSKSAALPVTITSATTTTALGNPSFTGTGTVYQLTATVSTQSNGAGPTGTVQFLANGNPVGIAATLTSSNATSSGPASAQVIDSVTLPVGNLNLSARYNGDSNYAGSVSSSVPLAVSDYSISVNPTTVTIPAPGKTATVNVTLTPLGGYNGLVYLGCDQNSETEYGIVCSGSTGSNQVSLFGTSPVTVPLTISTVGAPSMSPPSSQRRSTPPAGPSPALWLALAGLLLVLTALALRAPRRTPLWLSAGALAVVAVWVACGGGTGGGGGGGQSPTVPPTIYFTPTSLGFPSQLVGTSSASSAVLLSYNGTGDLLISNVAISGSNSSDFSETNDCANNQLAPGYLCHIWVTFTPSAGGTRTASLLVTDSASDSPQTIAVSGTGTVPSLAFSPSSLAFGAVGAGATSTPAKVTVTNSSNVIVTISSIQFGSNLSGTNTCGSSLVPGGTCTITATFSATTTGPLTSDISVYSSSSSNPLLIPATAYGITGPGTYTVGVSAYGPPSHSTTITVKVQ